MKKILFVLLLFLPLGIFAQDMTVKKMGKILKKESKVAEGEDGVWSIEYKERLLFVITDEKANRMRIFSPIVAQDEVNEKALLKMLEANFHSALDAKYGVWEGFVVSLFTHPLRELTTEQFKDALLQVVRLVETFGTTFSSTEFIFGDKIEEKPRVNQSPKNKQS